MGEAKPRTMPTLQAVAEYFGVHRRTVMEWSRDPDWPAKGKRGYSRAKIERWVEARRERSTASGGEGGPASERERLRTIRELIAVEAELGRVLWYEDVEGLIRRLVNQAKAFLEAMPDRIADHLSDEDAERVRPIVEDQIDQVLACLSEMARGDDDDRDEEPDPQDA